MPIPDSLPALTVGDLIEVPPVQTVVHLSDLTQASRRASLAESFVLTDEVRSHLRRLLAAFTSNQGLGAFLRGHYGSGKSHFLVFLQLLLTDGVDRTALAKLEPDLASTLEALADRRFLVATISLVDHSAQEPLESIVTGALESLSGPAPLPFPDDDELKSHLDTLRYHLRQHHPDTLFLFLQEHDLTEVELFVPKRLALLDQLAREVRFPFRPDPGRAARFEHLFGGLQPSGYSGVVLLLDELSEFLHSKNGSALAEDVRFLQFLGETTSDQPLYILAALQEYLEAAEYGLPGELVRKIKDRYPNNLELTTTHIEEIIARRLIRHKPGSEEAIEKIHRDLRQYLQGFPVPLARFARAYPIHPATILLLDRLKPLLSRSRGVVDFIHYRLRGSAERGMTGLLEAPADTLLTPDAIFDHFEVRIRENVEIAAYDTVVFEYYKRVLEVLFPDEEVRELAFRAVKMLILLAISPEPRPYSVRTLTHALLVRVSRIDPEANFLHVQDILDTLVGEGAYLERVGVNQDGRPSFDDVYRLSLKADLNLVASRRVQAAVSSLRGAADLRIFEALAPGLGLESLPLNRFVGQGSQIYTVQWQRTPREGRVTVGALTQIDVPRLVDTLGELSDTERDWALFIGVPYDVEAQRNHLKDVLLPALRRAGEAATGGARGILFWIPEPLSFEGPDGEFLRETLARRAVLSREKEEGGTSQAQGVIELLEKQLVGDKARIEQLFHQAYYQGRIESVAGEEENIASLGRPFFDQTLLAVLTPVMASRFPEHAACAPLGRMPSLDDVEAIVDRLYRSGAYQPKGGDADPLATRMVSLLRPLGLVKKTGAVLTLSAETSRPGAAKAFLAHLDDKPRSLKEIALSMRKGPMGIVQPMFQLLTLGLAYTGAIVCYSNGRRREVGQLSGLNFDQIQEIARAEQAQLDLSPLGALPFLAEGAVPRGELTFARQEQLWQSIREARDRMAGTARRVREGLALSTGYRALSGMDRGPLETDLKGLEPILEAIQAGVGVREGLERTLQTLREAPEAKAIGERLEAAAGFFQVGIERFLRIHRYMDQVGAIPGGLDYAELRERREEVEERLRGDGLLTDPGAMERLEATFRRFQAVYVEQYRLEHDRWRGPARFAVFEALRSAPAHRVLGRLARLGSLAVDDRKGALDRRLSEVLAGRCPRLGIEDLVASARCACGFALGDSLPLPDPAELETLQSEGIRASLEALAAPGNVDALRGAGRDLEQVGRGDDAGQMRALVAFLERAGWRPDPPGPAGSSSSTWSDVDRILTDRSVREVEQALSGVSMVEERDLERLLTQLQDRCLPRDEVERLVGVWLGVAKAGQARPFYRFVRQSQGKISASRGISPELEALIRRQAPGLLEAARELGDESLLTGAFLAAWSRARNLSAARRQVLLDRWGGVLSEQAWSELPALVAALREGPRDRLEAALATVETALLRDGLVPALAEALELRTLPTDTLVELFQGEETFPPVLEALARELAARIEQGAAQATGHSAGERAGHSAGEPAGERAGHSAGQGIGPSGDQSGRGVSKLPDRIAQPGELPGPIAVPRQELGQALLELEKLEPAIRGLNAHPPGEAGAWEKANHEQLSVLPGALYAWLGAASRWGLLEVEDAAAKRRGVLEALRPMEAAFARTYACLSQEPERPEMASRWLDARKSAARELARTLGDPEPTWIVLDGLRWDLWRFLAPMVGRLAGGALRVVLEETGWVRPSGAPERSRASERLVPPAGESGPEGQQLLGIPAGRDRTFGAANLTDEHLIRIPVVLDRLRRSLEPLPVVYGELAAGIGVVLRPTLEALPSGRVAILTGETGFRELASFDPVRDQTGPRYASGGISPWELLVPLIVLHRPGRSRTGPQL